MFMLDVQSDANRVIVSCFVRNYVENDNKASFLLYNHMTKVIVCPQEMDLIDL